MALKEYHKINNFYPSKMIVYRDGVSDGQRRTIEAIEIPAMKSAIEEIQEKIELIVICVNKMINHKFYMGDNLMSNPNNFRNPMQGTLIVDPSINQKNDFYLISQKSTQGIAKPTHYYVFGEVNDQLMKNIYQITYKLSYLYYNWAGSIKVIYFFNKFK